MGHQDEMIVDATVQAHEHIGTHVVVKHHRRRTYCRDVNPHPVHGLQYRVCLVVIRFQGKSERTDLHAQITCIIGPDRLVPWIVRLQLFDKKRGY
jgi:hypothetical protein